MKQNKIKWGIIGAGNIANKFAQDLVLIEGASLEAVASRSLEKAKAFGSEHGANKCYDSYTQLFEDPAVDIVYIATPHSSHCTLSIEAMDHKKHVLCEKPVAMNAREVKQMIEKSKAQNVFLMEAFWTRFMPSFIEIKDRIEAGDLGEIKYLNADFSFKVDKPLDGRVLNKALGGGALLDIGIYPIFMAYMILGKPKEILASSILHPEAGSDVQTSMIFNYHNAQAVLYCSFLSKSEMMLRISGTDGQLYLNDSWHAAEKFTFVKDEEAREINKPRIGLGYAHEILACHESIAQRQIENELWSHQNSLDLIGLLDEVREIIGLHYEQE